MQKIHIGKMKQVCIIRPLDKLGRVVIPMEFRKTMDVGQNALLEQRLFKDENDEYVLVIRKTKRSFKRRQARNTLVEKEKNI